MAYPRFLIPNKPCFLKQLYLHPIENLHNDRTLFDGDNLCNLKIKFFKLPFPQTLHFPTFLFFNENKVLQGI